MNPRFDAVLFDCDGVLIDSETVTNRVLWSLFRESGWDLTPAECMEIFLGKTIRSEAALIERETGRPLTQAWLDDFYQRRNQALIGEATAIAHVHDAVQRIHLARAGRIACASGADRFKVELLLTHLELMPYFKGQIYSGHETPRSKPFADVYLAAAAGLGVDARRCAVVEDTPIGVRAGVAAGATVFAYLAPGTSHMDAPSLLHAGAHHVFVDMRELPDLLLG